LIAAGAFNRVIKLRHFQTALRQKMLYNQRHHEIEKDRAGLIARLSAIKEPSRKHPSYKRALSLLNNTFGKSSLAQRTRRPKGGHVVDQYCRAPDYYSR
jgi:hypothetical protein